MQALILAAGMGARLGAFTEGAAKCMVRLNGRTLIERLLDDLATLDLSRVVLVVGHGGAGLRAALGDAYRGLPIVYVENPAYRTTNNSYSLALAVPQLCADDTLLLESDLVLDPTILRRCAAASHPAAAVLAPLAPWMQGTLALLDAEGFISRFVPWAERAPAHAAYYKTVNVYRLSRTFSAGCLAPALHAHLAAAGPHDYYEVVFGALTAHAQARMRAVLVDDCPWYEIDTPADLRAAEALFAEHPDEPSIAPPRSPSGRP